MFHPTSFKNDLASQSPVLVCAMKAAATRYVKHPSLTPAYIAQLGETYANTAAQQVHEEVQALDCVRSLILLMYYYSSIGKGYSIDDLVLYF